MSNPLSVSNGTPSSAKLKRRAIQLGLRGSVLESYAREWIVDIKDISSFVREQHQHVLTRTYEHLVTSREREYTVDPALIEKLGIEPDDE